MRAYVPDYTCTRATGLDHALQLMAQGGLKPLAGGTDLMVVYNAGKLTPTHFLDVSRVQELKGIEVTAEAVRLGALVTCTELIEHPVIGEEFPSLVQAARETGAVAIQNRATLGGNIANGSPAADSPPALQAYGASITLISAARGKRTVDYGGFHQGYKKMDLQPDELILELSLPRRPARLHYYRKVGTRKAQAISKVCLCASGFRSGDRVSELRLSYGSLAPMVVLCPKTAERLQEEPLGKLDTRVVRELLAQEISPIDDVRSTRQYRLRVAENLLADLWESWSVS